MHFKSQFTADCFNQRMDRGRVVYTRYMQFKVMFYKRGAFGILMYREIYTVCDPILCIKARLLHRLLLGNEIQEPAILRLIKIMKYTALAPTIVINFY